MFGDGIEIANSRSHFDFKCSLFHQRDQTAHTFIINNTMKFTTTILQALVLAQAISFGAAKRGMMKYYYDEDKGKGGGDYEGKGGDYEGGKGYSSSSSSGKGKGGSYSSSGKGKGYTPPTHPSTTDTPDSTTTAPDSTTTTPDKCDGLLDVINDNTFKSMGNATQVGDDSPGTLLLFSDNEVTVNMGGGTVSVGKASGSCTVLGNGGASNCLVTVDVDEAGSIAHQGNLAVSTGTGKLVVTGGSDCFEGIVGTATVDIDKFDDGILTLGVDFDVRVL